MLKIHGLRWGGVALLAALLLAPEAAFADGRAASTRSDSGVSSRGGSSGSSGSSKSATSSSASRSSSRSSSQGSSGGRVAVPRSGGSGSSHSSSASRRSGSDQPARVAVPRTPSTDHGMPDRTRGRDRHHHDPRRTIVVGGWWHDPYWWYGPRWGFWGSWWGPWGPYPYGYGDYGYRHRDDAEGYGALDTDIAPEDAEVWIDGERVGTADDFDGFPSYLWLPAGTYDVVFYLPGYRTLARQYTIYRGVIIDVEDRLERGESVHPNDLQATSTVNRDARLQRNREREEAARAREAWRERRDRKPADTGVEEPRGERTESVGRLHVRIVPADASVYLDGNFLGTGSELEQLSAGLVVEPGPHTLQVVRPGYESEDVSFDSDPGEALELTVTLEPDE